MAETRLILKQYYWNGSQYTCATPYGSTSGTFSADYDLILDPKPNEVGKSLEIPFRTSNLGQATTSGRRRLGKGKWRKKTKMEITLTGECNGNLRRNIEWAATRWSKWLIWETNIDNPLGFKMSTPEPDRNLTYSWATNEWVYVVFNSVDFTQTSKVDWYRYTIKLTRVDKRDITEGEPGTYY